MDSSSTAGADEDPEHPIPRLDTYDVVLETNRGAYVGIVIATPLRDDAKSRARLERKFQMTLDYFARPEFRQKHGTPDHGHCLICISVHVGTDLAMLELIDHYCSQCTANGVATKIEKVGTN